MTTLKTTLTALALSLCFGGAAFAGNEGSTYNSLRLAAPVSDAGDASVRDIRNNHKSNTKFRSGFEYELSAPVNSQGDARIRDMPVASEKQAQADTHRNGYAKKLSAPLGDGGDPDIRNMPVIR